MKLIKLVFVFLVQCCIHASELDIVPAEVIQKAVNAANALSSYKSELVIDSIASVEPQTGRIFQKRMSDGSIALRMEIKSAAVEKSASISSRIPYTLILPHGTYVVADGKPVKIEGMSATSKLANIAGLDVLNKAAKAVESEQKGYSVSDGGVVSGSECWSVSIPVPVVSIEAIKKMLGHNSTKTAVVSSTLSAEALPIPVKIVLSIDKKSYLVLRQDAIDATGRILQSMTFQNVQPNAVLDDSLFSLPDK
jgi:hypothetical protein